MGTPFKGSDKAGWAVQLQEYINKLPLVTTSKELLPHLDKASDKLATLGHDFPLWLYKRQGSPDTKVRVMCFWEALDTKFGRVVTCESAEIVGQESESIHANHTEMCKFATPDDVNYKKVVNVLRRWVKEITDSNKPEETTKASCPVGRDRQNI